MFATSKFVRLAGLAMLAALPIGSGLFQPAGAKADEIIRLVRHPVVVARPVVTVAPAAPVIKVAPAPVVRVAPVVPVATVYTAPAYRTWYGYRWYR
jgi:hypothetical protein